jgi:hypothetical protein
VVHFTAVGTCKVDAKQVADSNWNAAAQIQRPITVNKGTPTLAWSTNPSPKTVGSSAYIPTATSLSPVARVYTLHAGSTGCTISGSTISFIAVGTCLVDADQAADSNWNAAAQVHQSITVNKGTPTITWTSTPPGAASPSAAGSTIVAGTNYTPLATSQSTGTVTYSLDSTSRGCTFISGVVSFTAVGTCVIDANQAVGANWNAAAQVQQKITVAPAPVSFLVTASASVTAGGSFGVTVTARTGAGGTGSTVTAYVGTVLLTSTDAAAVIPASYKFQPADHGAHTFTVTLKTAGPRTVTATQSSITGTTGSITVHSAAAAKFTVSGVPTSLIPGTAASVTVTARDAFGNVSAYTGTIHFTSTDSAATLPANYTFLASNGGTHAFSNGVVFRTAGTRTITATDTVTASITGLEGGILIGYPASTYFPIAPARVLDTRPNGSGVVHQGAISGALTAGTVRSFAVANATYVGGGSAVAVPSTAVAVTGNLTVALPTAAGLIALGPTMTATGEVTTLNFTAGELRANNVTIGLAPGGTLQAVFRSATVGANVHLIFDVTGYFLPGSAAGARWHAVTAGRVLDTRPTGSGVYHMDPLGSGPFKSGTVRNVKVAGVIGTGWSSALVPSNATAVTGNVTVTSATTAGFVAFGPTMISAPATSTLNVSAGAISSNGVTVALKSGNLQAVWVSTSTTSTADVVFDITGYFTTDGTGQAFHAVTPFRVMNSATGKGPSSTFASESPQRVLIGGVGEIPIDALGISGNLTLVSPSSGGFAFIGPVAVVRPPTSTLNAVTHATVANGFDVKLSSTSSGKVAIVWDGSTGSTANLTLDVTGYWK